MKIRLSKQGVHVFNRSSGTNALFDEIPVPAQLWHRAPRYVSIALTNACDLSCEYCYAPKSAARLHFSDLSAWLTELDVEGCLGIGFGGGEPTLHNELPQICRFTTANTKLAVSITTHAHRFNDSLACALEGNIHYIRASMDGLGDTYEKLRGRSFESFCNGLRCLSKIAPFGINFVVNNQTVADLNEAVTFASTAGATEFLLLPQQATKTKPEITREARQTMKEWVASYKGSLRLAVSEAGSGDLPVCPFLDQEDRLLSFAHIDAEGFLKRSSYERAGVRIDTSVIKSLNVLRETKEQKL